MPAACSKGIESVIDTMKNKLYRASITLPNGKRKWIRSLSQEGLE